jgi:hypothetical protein
VGGSVDVYQIAIEPIGTPFVEMVDDRTIPLIRVRSAGGSVTDVALCKLSVPLNVALAESVKSLGIRISLVF